MRQAALAVLLLLLIAAPVASAATAPTGTLDLTAGADVTFTPGSPDSVHGAVAAVGDVNGDGTTDFAVGYPRASRLGRDQNGVIKVVFGGGNADKGFEIVGNVTHAYMGTTIAGAGDINGDGLGDLLIGRPGGYLKTPGEGVVYVVFGRADSTQVDIAKLGSGGFRIYGAPGDHAGTALAAVGDLDGDGRPEIAVGAPTAAPAGRALAGRVMIVLSSLRAGNVDLATVGAGALEIDGAAAGSCAGSAVAGLPDVNGDGRPDLAIGAPASVYKNNCVLTTKYASPGNGSVAIVHVPAPGAPPVDLGALLPGQGATLAGPAGAAAGWALASVGDLGGDGVPDLAVGAPLAAPYGRVNAGAVYVVSGAADGSGSLDAGGPWLVGARGGDRLGSALDAGALPGAAVVPPSRALAVGAPISNHSPPTIGPLGRAEPGAAYVVFPAAAPALIDLALPPASAVERLVGSPTGHAGTAVALANDGATSSVLVGAAHAPDAAAWLVRDVGAPGLPTPQGGGCVGNTNLEVIVDDSGSMMTTDPQALRQQALDLLLTKPGNLGRITGAVEFGSFALEIFPPVAAPGSSTGALHDALAGLMAEHIRHNSGQTNFTAAFLAAGAQNPQATARIFISDGFATKAGVPPFDTSVAQGPPTYVIGLGPNKAPGADRRMGAIANSTGGQYFPRVTAAQLAPVVDTIDALGLCGLTALPTAASGAGASGGTTPTLGSSVKAALPERTTVNRRHPVARFTTSLVGGPSVVDFTLTWDDKSAKVRVSPLTLGAGKRTRVVPAATVRKALHGHTPGPSGSSPPRWVHFRSLRLRGSRGKSFATLRVAGLNRATAGRAVAYAASGWRKAHWGARGQTQPGGNHGGHKAARPAHRAVAIRISLSAYRRR